MIIGIDGNEANVERKVGISEYAFELLVQFEQSTRNNPQKTLAFQIYLKDTPRPEMPKEREGWKYIIVKPRKLWTQIGLPLYLFTHFPRPSVFFSPTHYAPRFCPVPTAISIMDLSFIHFPALFAKKDLYQLANWTKYSAKKAKKIFTISTASKNDILKEYRLEPGKVVVTYPGIKGGQIRSIGSEQKVMKEEVSTKELEKKFGISENYILFVGTLQPRKNIARLIEAFASLTHSTSSGQDHKTSNIKDLQLVIVGKKGWLYEDILKAPEKYGVTDHVKFLEFVDNADLPSLYKHAIFYILPSLYEGFGLPVVEAMKYGTPVITSNVSSLPEAGGDAALYVDPLDTNDIAEKMQKLLADKKLRETMVKKGYEHIKKFSWEKAAKETLDVLMDITKHKT